MKMKKESRPLKKNKDSTLAETKNNNGKLRMLKGSVRDPRSYSLPREKMKTCLVNTSLKLPIRRPSFQGSFAVLLPLLLLASDAPVRVCARMIIAHLDSAGKFHLRAAAAAAEGG